VSRAVMELAQTQRPSAAQIGSPTKGKPTTHIPRVGQNGSAATKDSESHGSNAARNGTGANLEPNNHASRAPAFAFLSIAAENLDDLEAIRKAAENRARALTHPEQNIGLAEDDPLVQKAVALAQGLAALEKDATKEIERLTLASPIAPWVKENKGIGAKTIGRLLGVIGDPLIRIDGETGEVSPRSVSQLRSYCGFGDAREQRRRKGEQVNWNPRARTAIWNCAHVIVYHRDSPYRLVYDEARAKYEGSVHEHECRNQSRKNPNGCGTQAHPEWGAVGSPLRDGHIHARALRAVAKRILKDLWLAADQPGSE
jgi:hypothetical protein